MAEKKPPPSKVKSKQIKKFKIALEFERCS
jgi:hypothetical protein